MTTPQDVLAQGDATASPTSGKVLDAVQWLTVGLAVLVALASPALAPGAGQAVFFISLLFSVLHGPRRYGWWMAIYLLAALVVSNLLENSSILWGFPFGHYHYTLGPKLFLVPLVVGPFYVAMGYVSWQTANVLLGFADRRLSSGLDVVLLPAIAAALMTMFDLTTDPQASTITHAWIWRDGGGFYGVPYTNFLGWWFVTYIFFQIFALALRGARLRLPARSRGFWLAPVLLYLNLGLSNVVTFLVSDPGGQTVVDQAGRVWKVAEIAEGTFTVWLFTVLVMVALALSQLLRGGEKAI